MTGTTSGEMRIRVDFTISVPAESLAALRELAAADDNAGARLFVEYEAQDYLIGYLTDNGVPASVVREKRGGPVVAHRDNAGKAS